MAGHPPSDPAFFREFKIHDVVYKTVDNHDIGLSILVPNALLSGAHKSEEKRPVIVRFHGGFLVGGSRLYTDWFPKWSVKPIRLQQSSQPSTH